MNKLAGISSLRSMCDQFAAEYRANASTMVQQETRRTNKLTLLGYLDTVEVIGSIPVAPIRFHLSPSEAVECARSEPHGSRCSLNSPQEEKPRQRSRVQFNQSQWSQT